MGADTPRPTQGRRGAWARLERGAVALLCVLLAGCYFSQEQRQAASLARSFHLINRGYVDEVDRTELYETTMRAMVDSLDDRYTAYLSPEQLQGVRMADEGAFGGIGVSTVSTDGVLLVVEVWAETPAARAGIQPGDLIVEADGRALEGLTFTEVAALIRGEPGTTVRLTIARRAAGRRLAMELEREEIVLPNVQWGAIDESIGLVRIVAFNRHSADQTEEALERLGAANIRGLVLDLRNNPGGLLGEVVRISDMFLPDGVILTWAGREEGDRRDFEAGPEVELAAGVPVAVLVDDRTASAAEVLAGALQANGRAVVVGAPTVGKGSISSIYGLPDGGGLVLTVARYTLAGGLQVEQGGVRPDVVVGELPPFPEGEGLEPASDWIQRYERAKREQFDRAVEVLRARMTAP